jgi:ABC-type phosphate/phosphonate transport system substrate-binding protein
MKPNLRPLVLCLLLLIALSACRRADSDQQLSLPTLTPTPRSTPLPALPTAVPPGAEDNPLRMVLRPAGPRTTANNAAGQLEEALLEEAGLAVELVLVDRYAEALAALCESTAGRVSVAWLDGLALGAAQAQGCGTPMVLVERGGRDAQTGEVVQMVANSDLGVGEVAALEGTTFCRVSYTDPYTWLIPSLLLQSGGVRPLYDLEAVNDYEDTTALLEAVASGECDAAGLAQTDFEADADADVRDGVTVLAETPPFPYDVLFYPLEAPLGVRIALNDALLAIAEDPARSQMLEDLLDIDGLRRVETGDFDDLNAFLERTGLDLGALGG